MTGSTITAISTPSGEGGIAVIRISGKDAITIADRIFICISEKKLCEAKGYTAHYGKVVSSSGEDIDEGVATVYRAPKSYTGEDVAEISVHGGQAAAKLTLRAAIQAGASYAEAGEFTRRAFLNGKLSLAEAESVMGLITARSEEDLKLQLAAKKGSSSVIGKIRDMLKTAASDISAFVDFPDEDLPGINPKGITEELIKVRNRTKALIDAFDRGRILHEGVRTAIAGAPNVGKSTLLNMLSGYERAIVTDIPGTTRDIIEQTVMLDNIPLVLYDTAGLRDTDDKVESVGIELAEKCISDAQLILAVFDGTKSLDASDLDFLDSLKNKNVIAIVNKNDLGTVLNQEAFGDIPSVFISAKDSVGLDALTEEIKRVTETAYLDPASAVLSSERQRGCAVNALASIEEAIATLQSGFCVDVAGVCVNEALQQLLTLTGEKATDEVVDEVFRRFCIGK